MEKYTAKVSSVTTAEVIVCGGGCAGVVAAIASARNGVKTILVEKTSIVGGTATNGLVGPFMTCFDPSGKQQIIKGIFNEIIERMEEKGGAVHPSKTGAVSNYGCYIKLRHNNVTPFHPETLKMVLLEMLVEAGVECYLNTTILDVEKEGDRVTGIVAFDGNDLRLFEGKIIIDCTGDAFVNVKAGAACEMEDVETGLQPMTLFFWIYNADDEKIEEFLSQDEETRYLPYHHIIEKARQEGKFNINRNKIGMYHMVNPGEWRLNTTRIQGRNPVDSKDMNQAYMDGMRQVDFLMEFFKQLPGLENARLAQVGANVGVRESRRIIGEYILTEQDMIENTEFQDTIALCSYPVDLHPAKGALTGTSYKKEHTDVADVYEIPFRILLTRDLDNVLTAGRCVSATHEALGAIRIMPSVFAMAQAAGTAAALAVRSDIKLKQLDTKRLQEILEEQGQCLKRHK